MWVGTGDQELPLFKHRSISWVEKQSTSWDTLYDFHNETGRMTSQREKTITSCWVLLWGESMRAALGAVSEMCFLASTQETHMNSRIWMTEPAFLPIWCYPSSIPQKVTMTSLYPAVTSPSTGPGPWAQWGWRPVTLSWSPPGASCRVRLNNECLPWWQTPKISLKWDL